MEHCQRRRQFVLYFQNVGATSMKLIPAVIDAYKTPDNVVHTDYKKAVEHYENLIGEELDALTNVGINAGQNVVITRSEQYKLLMGMLSNLDKIKPIIDTLHHYLNYNGIEDDE